MVMARTQTLVQLDDRLLGLLDERAAARGISRSALVREAIEAYMADDLQASIDRAIVDGYTRLPASAPDAETVRLAVASIEEEPW
jgi:metal-responsive CopG/Arc/MetJ family transcriptional regulator